MKTITPEHIQEVLHYADEFPHSGQNRELAEIVRHILAPSAPLVAVGDTKWSDEFSKFEAWERDTVMPSPWSAWHERATLAGQVAPQLSGNTGELNGQLFEKFEQLNSGQVAPQATVEPLTAFPQLSPTEAFIGTVKGNVQCHTMTDVYGRTFYVATPPTSKATPVSDAQIMEAISYTVLLASREGFDEDEIDLSGYREIFSSVATSKADTGSIRNAALEEAAAIAECYPKYGEATAEEIRALKGKP